MPFTKYLGVIIDGAITFNEHLKYVKEKTDKRIKSIVYLNQKEMCPDLIIKAFQSYIISIYIYHGPIIALN